MGWGDAPGSFPPEPEPPFIAGGISNAANAASRPFSHGSGRGGSLLFPRTTLSSAYFMPVYPGTIRAAGLSYENRGALTASGEAALRHVKLEPIDSLC